MPDPSMPSGDTPPDAAQTVPDDEHVSADRELLADAREAVVATSAGAGGASAPALLRWQRLLAVLAPGLLAGAQLAGLLFFLNPELPFRALPLLRAVGVYAVLLAFVSLLVQAPLLVRRHTDALRALPWSLAVVLLAFALLDAAQASWYAFYLPTGINVRLLKAAAWLAVLGVATLYTAIVHSLARRRYGVRSRWGLAALAVVSLYVVVERREAYQPPPESTPVRSLVEGQRALDLYVVGIDAATLDALLPLAEQGRLPFIAELLREGSYARLRSLTPTRQQPLWATLATGKYPFRHGLRGDTVQPVPLLGEHVRLRLLPVGIGFAHWGPLGAAPQPPGVDERRARALWEILARLEVPTGLVGWMPGPPPAGLSFALPEGFFAGRPELGAPAPLAAGAALFHVGADQIDPLLLESFGPRPPAAAVRALSGDLWRESAAFWLLDREEPRALFLRLPGMAVVAHRWFGGYAAQQLEGVQGERSAPAARLVEEYYRHLDDYLGQLWNRTHGPRLLAVVSPYGVTAAGGWRRAASFGRAPLQGVISGNADGVLLLRGDGIRRGGFVAEAGIEDVVPTLLYALNLPVGRDMDGRTLTGAFEPGYLAAHPLSFVPSYEALSR
jgi:hypothetical protein